jgi:hypothetical protein
MSASSDVEGITSEQITTIEQNPPNPDTDAAEGVDSPTSTKQVSTQSSLSESSNQIVPLVGKRGGPRTSTGKERSKRNALKLGFFSKAVVLNFESRSEFDALLRGFRYDLKPEGMLEETLVLKLATTLWRWRRLLLAENGEVQKGMQSWQWEQNAIADRAADRKAEYEKYLATNCEIGRISKIGDSETLELCLKDLRSVKKDLDKFGFEETLWISIGVIYGARVKGQSRGDFYDFYIQCCNCYEGSEEKRKKAGFASPEDCLEKCMAALEKEIQRLEDLRKQLPESVRKKPPHDQNSSDVELHLRKIGFLQKTVPAAPDLERLLRYEAHLERVFDRTLGQLERLQRIRHGLPVLPTINVRTLG